MLWGVSIEVIRDFLGIPKSSIKLSATLAPTDSAKSWKSHFFLCPQIPDVLKTWGIGVFWMSQAFPSRSECVEFRSFPLEDGNALSVCRFNFALKDVLPVTSSERDVMEVEVSATSSPQPVWSPSCSFLAVVDTNGCVVMCGQQGVLAR